MPQCTLPEAVLIQRLRRYAVKASAGQAPTFRRFTHVTPINDERIRDPV